MKEYKLMKTDYVTSCIYSTNDLITMKNKIISILATQYQNYKYALSGIRKLDPKQNYFESCWIEVYENNKLIQSVSIEKGDELK